MAQFAQALERTSVTEHVHHLTSAIFTVKKDKKKGITHLQLVLHSLQLVVYTDGSFARNKDGGSQLGYMISLANETRACNILKYRSFKSRCITGAILGAKLMAFGASFDCSFILKDFEDLLCDRVPLLMYTYSRSLFDVIIKPSSTS